MSLQPLDGPRKGGGSRLVAGRQHRDQLVGDLRARHRRTVLAAAVQHESQYVVALAKAGISTCLIDELPDDRIVFTAVPKEPAPRTPTPPTPLRHRDQCELRAESDA